MKLTLAKEYYNVLKHTFFVKGGNLNNDGELDICTILNEVLKLIDAAVVKAYGVLDYNRLVVWRSNVNFLEDAVLDDLIELESYYKVAFDNSLEIKLVVNKRNEHQSTLIAEGNFLFGADHHVNMQYSLS